jgi:hypothetical protein
VISQYFCMLLKPAIATWVIVPSSLYSAVPGSGCPSKQIFL